MTKTYKRKIIHWGEEFEEELEKFNEMIKEDAKIIETIPSNNVKRAKSIGLFSHAIKYLIIQYNQKYWQKYLDELKQRR